MVASYVWPNVCLEWLQVVSGQVLYGGNMCICGSVGEGVFINNETVHTWSLGEWGSRKCALCRGCYSTGFVVRGGWEGSLAS